jgi:hypothetical protein
VLVVRWSVAPAAVGCRRVRLIIMAPAEAVEEGRALTHTPILRLTLFPLLREEGALEPT